MVMECTYSPQIIVTLASNGGGRDNYMSAQRTWAEMILEN